MHDHLKKKEILGETQFTSFLRRSHSLMTKRKEEMDYQFTEFTNFVESLGLNFYSEETYVHEHALCYFELLKLSLDYFLESTTHKEFLNSLGEAVEIFSSIQNTMLDQISQVNKETRSNLLAVQKSIKENDAFCD